MLPFMNDGSTSLFQRAASAGRTTALPGVAVDFKQAKLDNGLTIIAEVSPAAASMALGFFVRTGSRDETDDVHGVSH